MITVRAATTQDAGVISDLCAQVQELHHTALPALFKPGCAATFPHEDIIALMSEAGNYFFIAQFNEDIAGYAYATWKKIAENAFHHAYDQLHIDQIGVHPHYRSLGCGKALMETIKSLAISQNIPLITLSTWDFNHQAHTFFASQGFEPFLHNYWYWVNQPG